MVLEDTIGRMDGVGPAIRSYEMSDLKSVIGIFRSNIPKYFCADEEPGLRSFLKEPPGEYFVYDADGKIVGAGGIALNECEGTVSLCWGMIHSDYLGTGLGLVLTRFRIEAAGRLYGPRPLIINTSQHTQGFYEKLGFKLTRRVTDGHGPGIDICEMRLDLDDAKDRGQ